MPFLVIDRGICANLEAALDREWLVANGLGGYASSTIVGANTRRYHGLLVAAMPSSRDRLVLLSKIEEEVVIGDRTYDLSVNEYPDATIHPSGFVHLEEFRLEHGLPVFRFGMAGLTIEKRVWMGHERNTTYISYHLIGSQPVLLRLSLLANHRSMHALSTGALDRNFQVDAANGGCGIRAFNGATPYRVLAVPAATFRTVGVWYWHFVYRRERERGMDYTEDLYMPGLFEAHLEPGESVTLVATTEPADRVEMDAQAAWEHEVTRRRDLIALLNEDREDDFAAHLALAADQFLIRPPSSNVMTSTQIPCGVETGETVVAGYHWFADWGRDTAIALPGLTLSCGRPKEAERILRTWAGFIDDGLLPNRFPEGEEPPDYSCVDAPLWLFQAMDRYLADTSDRALLEEVYPAFHQVAESYIRGTRHGIAVDPVDGLLRAGESGLALTWMDARIDDWVVSPRSGKAVEVNALWYNALRLISRWSTDLGYPSAPFAELSELLRRSFARRFWYEKGGYLYDVVDGENGDDASLRPNQVIAIALPHALLPREQAIRVLETVERKLLTPVGLRTLSPDDPRFIPRYEGDRRQRDAAYHMGTVWPWLLGPYTDACLRLRCDAAVGRLLLTFQHSLLDAGLGSISELFDAVKPHTPRGCIAQAWSVAEVLRSWRKVKHFKRRRPSP